MASNLNEFGSEEVQSLDDESIPPLEEDDELGFVVFLLATFSVFHLKRMQV